MVDSQALRHKSDEGSVGLMQIDTLKALFTYLIALIIVVGGMVFLYVTRSDPDITDLRILIGGFMGSAITFVFGQETSTRTARQQANATAAATNGSSPH